MLLKRCCYLLDALRLVTRCNLAPSSGDINNRKNDTDRNEGLVFKGQIHNNFQSRGHLYIVDVLEHLLEVLI